MSEPEIATYDDGAVVTFSAGGHSVTVDTRRNDLNLLGNRRPPGPVRLAASRAGLLEVMTLVDCEFEEGTFLRATIESYLIDALLAAARRISPDVDAAFSAVDLIRRTPLVCCYGIVSRPHLLADIARLPAAAIAVCFIEDDLCPDNTVPEQTDIWAWRLSRWQESYAAPGAVQRSVNRTVGRFAEEATPKALFGLRRVVIDAPLPTVQHVDVLGALGALLEPGEVVSAEMQQAVLRATSQELGEALVLIDEGELDRVVFGREPPALRLAEILSAIPVETLREQLRRRVRFQELLAECIHVLRDSLQLTTAVMEPPVALPHRSSGVTFLATVSDILREGSEMDHCVATRVPRAMAGDSYLFHLSVAGAEATAEVARDGNLTEIRGPSNVDNRATRAGRNLMRDWGARLFLRQLGDPSERLASDIALPFEGLERVDTLGALDAIVTALTSPPEPGDFAIWRWAVSYAQRAMAGEVAFGLLRAAGIPMLLYVVNDDGTAFMNHTDVDCEETIDRDAVNEANEANVDGDYDDDWDLRT